MIHLRNITKEIMGSNFSIHKLHEHPLIFIEDLKVEGEKEVICKICEEPPSGPGYKCSECNFFCHKSCFDLPDEIQHPLHPNHSLFIRPPAGLLRYCDACGKCCRGCFIYWCGRKQCDFSLDTKCASRWQVNKNDCLQHAYIPFLKQIMFICEACGEKGSDIGCLCSICQLLVHTKCASLPRTIEIADHDHGLTLTYPVHRQAKEHANILCKLCSKEVSTKCASYYCHKCSYVAHLICARLRDFGEDRESASTGYIGHVTGLIKDINRVENEKGRPREIKHFSHEHVLILNYEELVDAKLCDGCMQYISPPFYSCAQCSFFLHNICSKLPTNARHLLLPSTSFTLLSQAPFSDGVFECVSCKQYRHGFAYGFGSRGKTFFDIQCFAIQKSLQHECHQHSLFFDKNSNKNCKFSRDRGVLVCSICNFALCLRCATLPLVVNHKYDDHPLKLTYSAEDKSGECYCLICEKVRNPNHLFYFCAECDFPAHPECAIGKYSYIKFGKTYKDEHHKHPFTFVPKTEYSSPCDACNLPFDGVALECTQCKLTVHPRFGFPQKNCLRMLHMYELAMDKRRARIEGRERGAQ
jgi:hypothetical protein